MIGISYTTQQAGGALLIQKDSLSEIKKAKARVSRSATLDLGAVLDHRGYSHADRIFRIVSELNETDAGFIWSLFKTEKYINISTSDGFFYGSISDCEIDRGQLNMLILIKE